MARCQWLLLAAFKFKVAHTILFLFFILTALVAFVLTETQKRMVTFAGACTLALCTRLSKANRLSSALELWSSALFQNRSHLQIPFANLVLVYFAQSLMFVPVLVRRPQALA